MNSLATWIRAARLRTLPLSVAGILAGAALASGAGHFDNTLFVLTLLTTLAYQITSNFANDYGDGVKGTDNDRRIGPRRVLQSGGLSPGALKNGIIVCASIAGLLTLATLLYAFGLENWPYLGLFLVLGGAAIWAAIRYTVGKNAYGYKGRGDLFVFLFFGLLSVLGSLFLYMETLTWEALGPAVAIGCLSVAVLNLNNLRDMESDRESNKRTLVVLMGFRNGVRYHLVLCLTAFLALAGYLYAQSGLWPHILVLLPFLIIAPHLFRVLRTQRPERLDPELKKVAISTFLIGLLLFLANHYFL